MKKFLFVLFLVPTLSLASGTIQVKPGYFLKAGKVGGQVGLSIWEPVVLGIHFGQWFGIGIQPRVQDDSVHYAVSESSLGTWFGRLGVDVGYKFQHADKANNLGLISEHSVFGKLSYKLW